MKFGVARTITASIITLICMAGLVWTIWGIHVKTPFINSYRNAGPSDLAFIEKLDVEVLEAFDQGKASPTLDHSALNMLASGKDKANPTIARLYLIKDTERRLAVSQSEQLRLDQELNNLIALMIHPRVAIEMEGLVLTTLMMFTILMVVLFAE